MMAKKVAIGYICSLMFFMHIFMMFFFYKSAKKHVFNVFYLQINVFNIYGTDCRV